MIGIAAKEGLATFTSNAIIVMSTYIHNISIELPLYLSTKTILEKFMNYALLDAVCEYKNNGIVCR